MRKDYEMTDADLAELISAMKPVPAIALHCGPVPSRQEMANAAWKRLGDKMGFAHMTVQASTRGNKFFSAEPLNSEVP